MAKKKIGVTIETALHNATKAAAAQRGLLLEAAYAQALEQWISGTGSTNMIPPVDVVIEKTYDLSSVEQSVAVEVWEYIRLAVKILTSEDDIGIRALKANLETFGRDSEIFSRGAIIRDLTDPASRSGPPAVQPIGQSKESKALKESHRKTERPIPRKKHGGSH